MTVKELRELLATYPDNMPICYSHCSQWTDLEAQEIGTIQAYDNGGYISQAFRPKDEARVKTYLAFPGN
jgi:hypothetical protein